ncbi:MAG TPA: hypothetical protein ENK57_24395, partial [Polyangiaceae bacterium]|nr:hypothetical protein [Polyangiaceae bacterium]
MKSLLLAGALSCTPLACSASPQAPPGEARAEELLVLEAEEFTRTSPEPTPKVKRHGLPFASERTALVGFATVDWIEWKWEQRGHRELWLRYASRRAFEMRWAVDGAWRTSTLPATGGLEGEDAWRWSRLGAIDTTNGDHTLRVAGIGIRPDCFALIAVDAGEPRWPREEANRSTPPKTLAALARIPPRMDPDWMERSGGVELPDWIETERVGLHTRLSVAWTKRPLFTQAAEAAASLGARSITRHVKSMRGECFWPSSLGAVAPWVAAATVGSEDPVEAMARRAHAAGVAFVAYYRHQEDRPLVEEHPGWICRDSKGRVPRTAGEPRLCFHSPFGEATLTRLLELADRGADG